MAKITPKWRVGAEATGQFRSFEKRAFPSAEYKNGSTCAMISHKDSYNPTQHKDATDLDLEVFIAVWNDDTFDWKRMVKRASSIAEAKQQVADFLNGTQRNKVVHPDYYEASNEI